MQGVMEGQSVSGQPLAPWAVCGVYQQRRYGRVG